METKKQLEKSLRLQEIEELPDSHLEWLLQQVFNRKFIASFIMIGTLLSIGLSMIQPILMGGLFDELWTMYTEHLNNSIKPTVWLFFSRWEVNWTILKYSLMILGLYLVTFVIDISIRVLNEYIAHGTERDIRETFYESVQSKSMTFHDSAKVGDLMAKATFDVRIINMAVSPGIRMITQLVFSGIATLIILFYYEWKIGLVILALTPFYFITARNYSRKLKPLTEEVQTQFGNANSLLQENVSGIRVVRAFTAEEYETKRFQLEIDKLRDDIINRGKAQALYLPPLILSIGIAIALSLSVLFIYQGTMTGGEAITINGTLIQLYNPTYMISWVLYITQMGIAGAKRILATMKEESIIEEKPNAIKIENVKGAIEYDQVTFSYQKLFQKRKALLESKQEEIDIAEQMPELFVSDTSKKVRNTLEDITFKVKAGEIVAILGPTGCGKSTLTKLLARMYDVDSGRILIDGYDIRDVTLDSLRKNIGVIEQDIFLFSTTIKENIAYGVETDIPDEKIIEIAKAAQAHEFITSFKNSYETVVGERGVTLSGGQKQRIAIARAFLIDPKILILDDSASAIDAKTEEKIQQAMDRLLQNRTVFIITHRLATIKRADKIIVLRKGRIVAQGTHEQLLRTSEDYRRVFGRHVKLPPLEVKT
ncbi:MAG: ATP-binding cassette domain-containing protein [Candidatus Heimdallarchaeota archaeon]|nr:ATP-binding cassette domain-containing protein [Candidatus Heimdallarchaeota archaeon]